jgi:hypothetical protein
MVNLLEQNYNEYMGKYEIKKFEASSLFNMETEDMGSLM